MRRAGYAHWDKIQDPFISNSYTGALSVAMGLPWTSQIAVSVPYVFDQGRDGNPSSSGLADVGFLLSKELLVENGPIPGSLARSNRQSQRDWQTVTMGMMRTTDPIKVKVRGGFSMLDMKHFVETQGFKGIGSLPP
jgi:hypothetical protein